MYDLLALNSHVSGWEVCVRAWKLLVTCVFVAHGWRFPVNQEEEGICAVPRCSSGAKKAVTIPYGMDGFTREHGAAPFAPYCTIDILSCLAEGEAPFKGPPGPQD